MTYYWGYKSYGYKSYSHNYSHSSYSWCKPKPAPAMESYEVTAFRESDLVNGNLGCGSKFTVPGSATTCLTIEDNDSKLSGDCRDNSTDSSGQKAAITVDGVEVGNGGQVYAESYHILKDSDGNKYILVEIEQEGTYDDYFTFYTGNGYTMPAAGTELTVVQTCNLSGVSFADLGAGSCDPAPVCDVAGSLEEGPVCYTITDLNNPAGSSDEAYSLTITSDGCLENVTFDQAYCLDIFLEDGTPSVDLCGQLELLDDASLAGASGVAAEDMDNVINYILNADNSAYTDAEVQGAIWGLMDGIVFVADGAGEAADAQAILDDALANGTGYEVAADGVHGVLITPDDSDYQRFVIGVECSDFIC